MAKVYDVFIPDLGADKDVDLIDIMVKIGDSVEIEDGLITLETEKASMDVPTPYKGKIVEILVKVGDKVNSGDLIAKVEATDEVEVNSSQADEVATTASKVEEVKEEIAAITPPQFVKEQTIKSVVEEVRVPDLGAEKDVDLIDVIVDRSGSRDIDRKAIDDIYEWLDNAPVQFLIVGSLKDISDDKDDFDRFMEDMSERKVVIMCLEGNKVIMPRTDSDDDDDDDGDDE